MSEEIKEQLTKNEELVQDREARNLAVEQKEFCYRSVFPWTNFTSIDLGSNVALLNGAPVRIRKEHFDPNGRTFDDPEASQHEFDSNRFRLVVSPLKVVYEP